MLFTKLHGAGNDYIYVDGRNQSRDWSAISIAMSDRHKGVGADGLILALTSDIADIRMRMFNADGSEGEMCGNGIRCLASFVISQGILPTDIPEIHVETQSGIRRVIPEWSKGRVVWASVEMGKPEFQANLIPVDTSDIQVVDHTLEIGSQSFEISCVGFGNPHAVTFINTPVAQVPLHEIGPLIEHHPMFPKRVNFEIARVLDSQHVEARVWERGSGLTEACGTGACAVGVVGNLKGLTGEKTYVALPGGELLVKWSGKGSVVLEGPISEVFDGEWPE